MKLAVTYKTHLSGIMFDAKLIFSKSGLDIVRVRLQRIEAGRVPFNSSSTSCELCISIISKCVNNSQSVGCAASPAE